MTFPFYNLFSAVFVFAMFCYLKKREFVITLFCGLAHVPFIELISVGHFVIASAGSFCWLVSPFRERNNFIRLR